MGAAVIRGLPSAITLGGLLLAFLSITYSLSGRYEAAAWLVFAATCADIFDGAAARALRVISPFGQQLDSLTDVVAAGVAPAVLVYAVYFEPWGVVGVVVAAAWVGLVAARLARFATTSAGSDTHFAGVPCPIAGTLVAHYVVFSRGTFGDDGSALVAVVIIVSLGALMLSAVPYWKSATLLPGQFLKHPYGPGAVATLAAVFVIPQQALFIGTGLSVVGATVIHAWPDRLTARSRTA